MYPISTKPFNSIEPPITLTLLPLSQIACALAQGDVQAALEHYHALDAETQKKLNTLCKKLSKNTPSVGGTSGMKFSQLLSTTLHCLSGLQKKEQISVLQQILKTIQSPDFSAAESVPSEESYSCIAESPFSMLPNELVFRILQEGEASSMICSFFKECQSGISSWKERKALNARYRTFQAELKQLNHFWHGALSALIAEMPAASELKSYQEISAIARNSIAQLAKYLPDDSEEGLTQLCQWIAAQHFKDIFTRKTLPDLIDSLRALMYSTNPNQALFDPVYDLLYWKWTERAYRACLQNPAIRTLGEGDVCAGISSVITNFLLRGQMNAIELANAAPIEQIKIQILASCIPEILDVADTTIVFDIACTIPDKEKRHTAFSEIATWLVAHGFSESDLFLKILEKLDEESANLLLQFLVKNLLEEEKGEKALLLAPRMTLSSESSKEIHAEVWCDLIQFFMDANDPNQAFALVDQLEERNDSTSQWKISELAVMLIKCGEYEKASCLTTKIMQFSDESFSSHHLRIVAEALAKKGKWEEFRGRGVATTDR